MGTKIEHPKVFVSYAWVDDENVNRVKDFVNRLRKDGIDTVFDQADLKPGQSMTHYMESCVRDSTVTNVLMLLTPEYKEKADMKKGGVGTETQIISQKVYSDVDNTKFVPVIFDTRGASIQDCLPIYLKSRFSINLSDPSIYEDEYMKLVRILFGAPTVNLQPIGSKPEWVDNPEVVDYDQNMIALLRQYKERHNEKDTLIKACDIAAMLIDLLRNLSFEHPFDLGSFSSEYSKTRTVRNTFLQMVYELLSNDSLLEFLLIFFDKFTAFADSLGQDQSTHYKAILMKMFKHELVISVIALLFKKRRFDAIHGLLSTSYVSYAARCGVSFHEYFYSCSRVDVYQFSEGLNSALSSNPNRRLLCGLADYWVHNTYGPMIGAEDFANADVLTANLCCSLGIKWFPLSYIYAPEFSNWICDLAISLTSKTLSSRLLPLFGVRNLEELKPQIMKIFELQHKERGDMCYLSSIRECPLISHYMKEADFLSKP